MLAHLSILPNQIARFAALHNHPTHLSMFPDDAAGVTYDDSCVPYGVPVSGIPAKQECLSHATSAPFQKSALARTTLLLEQLVLQLVVLANKMLNNQIGKGGTLNAPFQNRRYNDHAPLSSQALAEDH